MTHESKICCSKSLENIICLVSTETAIFMDRSQDYPFVSMKIASIVDRNLWKKFFED